MRQLAHAARLVRLVGASFVVSLLQTLAHRINLAVSLTLATLGAAGTIGTLAAVYAHVQRLAGWRFGDALVLVGVYFLVSALLDTLVEPNVADLREKVRGGQLDDLLLTPAPTLFTASFGACRPLALNGVLLGVAFLVSGIRNLGSGMTTITLDDLLGCVLLALAGVVVAWALRMLIASAAFWSPGLDMSSLYSSLWQFGRYPLDVYPSWVRSLLTYVIPVAFVSTLPARALTHGADPATLSGGLLAAVGSICVVRMVWHAGLRRYTSATS